MHAETFDGWWEHGLRPLGGGYSGEAFLAGEGTDRAVVRIYARSPTRAAIDASLLRLVHGLLPVPEVLELRHPTTTTPAILVTEYVAGARLDVVLAEQTQHPVDLAALGQNLAGLLNTLAGMPFLEAGGFVDASLTVSGEDFPQDLTEWAKRLRTDGRLAIWDERDWRALLDLLDLATHVQETAPAVSARHVLNHGDVNPKNILIDRDTAEVMALLDWEFAYAGSLHADLGNFTRFERDPRLIEPLLAGLIHPPGRSPTERRLLGRAADLWSLLDFAGGSRTNAVQALATELLLAQVRSNDLEAWPWPGHRVDPAPYATQ